MALYRQEAAVRGFYLRGAQFWKGLKTRDIDVTGAYHSAKRGSVLGISGCPEGLHPLPSVAGTFHEEQGNGGHDRTSERGIVRRVGTGVARA